MAERRGAARSRGPAAAPASKRVDPRAAAALVDRIGVDTGARRYAGAAGRHPDARGEGGLTWCRTNLSTRPFYNERARPRSVLALVSLLVLGLTAFNVVQVMRLTSRDSEVRRQADAAEADAARLRSEARVIRQTINRDQLAVVQAAAREANRLIDRRAFSWTDLFNRFEATLPGDVRIASVSRSSTSRAACSWR